MRGEVVPWYISNQAVSTKYWSNFLCPKSFACCHVQFAVWLICSGLERGRRWEEGNGRSDRNNVQLPLHLQLNAGKHLLPLPSIASIFLFVSSYVSPAFFFSFRSRVNFGMTFHRCRLSWSIESNLLWNEGELYEWASRQLSHSLALPLSLSLSEAPHNSFDLQTNSTLARRRDLMKDRYKRLTTCCTLHSLWIVSVIFKSVLHGKKTTIYHRSTDPTNHSATPLTDPSPHRWRAAIGLQTIREPAIASPWLRFR